MIGSILIIALFLTAGPTQSNDVAHPKHSEVREIKQPISKEGLNISIELDHDSYRIIDDPGIKVTIKNIGKVPISIYKNMILGDSLFLTIKDSNGKPQQPEYFVEPGDMTHLSRKDFVELKPDESFTKDVGFHLRSEGVHELGLYTVSISYSSPVSAPDAPADLNVWTTEKGGLESASVNFRVQQ